MKIRRRLYSIIPLIPLFVLLGTRDIRTLLLVPLALMAVQWYFMGVLFLLATAAFLIYTKTGGLYGLSVMALTVLALEMGYLDRERAPRDHYLILLAAVAMSFPTYLLMSMLSPALPRFEVTALAALLLVVLYLFARFVAS
ncbi:hypothetical protein [Thermococcus thioreducens]|uniref:Uncharacterized protein n=1 Tax=Thermococcus thioreducens TaxID=277988 RepID=A0A0Q2QTV5_9EURY|nr:hypothetical protein [Thermococcus thioreducens]ASJ11426.1 hypothetical protein A3L14_00345 [Thermococcus thioreducens]KQH83445.1 hypothetical protein AMR53_00350 [Thermococcus thioreducens]SEW06917.1 hypothetical protein SAMN05216170_1370 [Thermococcus thioreducens]